MKNRIISIILLAAVCLLSLSSCDYLFGDVADDGKVIVVVEESDGGFSKFTADLAFVEKKYEGAAGVLDYLSGRADRLYVETTDGGYGAYVTAIGSIRENKSEGMYVIVYTSVKADSYAGAPTVDYEGITMYQSGVGLSSMTVEAGTVILFRLEKSPY